MEIIVKKTFVLVDFTVTNGKHIQRNMANFRSNHKLCDPATTAEIRGLLIPDEIKDSIIAPSGWNEMMYGEVIRLLDTLFRSEDMISELPRKYAKTLEYLKNALKEVLDACQRGASIMVSTAEVE